MSNLRDRLKKNSTIKETDILKSSKFFKPTEYIPVRVPAINVAFSGQLDGGFSSGLTVWAGPSKHFKTSFLLLCVRAYMDKYPESVCLFYDSEFGSAQGYFESFGIDTTRVVHTPIADIEQLKFDIMTQLKEFEKGDRVFIAIDSVGNLASKKEVEDAVNQKSVADMTRAKQMKSLFRMVTPYLTLKDLPMHVVNHTYKTQEMYSKDVVSGGTGIYYSANNIFILGRQQEKGDDGIEGYNFVINVEKSRTVREKSKIIISVTYDDGIQLSSGLLEMALASGHVIKPNQGWYARVDKETGEIEDKKYRAADTEDMSFWKDILKSESFKKWVEDSYKIANGALIADEEVDDALAAVGEDDDFAVVKLGDE